MGPGRPKNQFKSVHKHLYIREHLCNLLDKEENKTKVVNEALTNYYKSIESSDEYLIREIEKHQRIINQLESTLKHNEELRNNKELREEKELEEYNNFCNFLKGDGSLKGQPYNTGRTNKEFGTKIKDWGHFLRIQKMYQDGDFGVKEFQLLKEGKL